MKSLRLFALLLMGLTHAYGVAAKSPSMKLIIGKGKSRNEALNSNPLKSIQYSKDNNGIYLSLTTRASTLNSYKRGVTIILDNGVRIIKLKEKISVEDDGGYVYMAFMKLSPSDIKKLKQSAIKTFKLYTYNEKVDAKIKAEALLELQRLAH